MKYPKANFKKKDGTYALVRCEECHAENYAPNVMSGYCSWCGYNINEKAEIKEEK